MQVVFFFLNVFFFLIILKYLEKSDAICGNGLVEDWEECDCGWEDNCKESCCYPQISDPPKNYQACRLKNTSTCSPSQGDCCSRDCKIYNSSERIVCSKESSCLQESICDGNSIKCPSPHHKPNKTRCDNDLVCQEGKCSASLCSVYDLEPCLCDNPVYECHLCCQVLDRPLTCKSSHQWENIPEILSKPGSPCNNYAGSCDVFHKCRPLKPENALNSLSNFLLSDQTVNSIKKWLQEKWYIILIAIILLIILLVSLYILFD